MIRYNRQSAGIECVRLMQLSFYETESHSCTISGGGGGVGKQTNQEWKERESCYRQWAKCAANGGALELD